MEQVCYDADERPRALDELDSLVEKGLVRVVGSGERYALLETIRAFAAEQLHAGGDVDATRIAHADYCLRFAEAAATALRGTEQLEAVRRARHENANTHSAIQWLIARARAGDAVALETGLLLCGYLNWFWHIGGQHLTARVHVDALLALARNAPPSRGRALARLAAGMISTATGEFERSLGEWAGGYEDAKAVGDAEAGPRVLRDLRPDHVLHPAFRVPHVHARVDRVIEHRAFRDASANGAGDQARAALGRQELDGAEHALGAERVAAVQTRPDHQIGAGEDLPGKRARIRRIDLEVADEVMEELGVHG